MATRTHPAIHTTLSLSPQNYTQGDEPPTLTITLTLSASAPITISTFHGIFNTRLALSRRNFTVHDLSTDPPTPTNIETTKGGRRPGFSNRKRDSDEQYYVTLYPGVGHDIQCPFRVVDKTLPVTSLPNLHTGRKYRLMCVRTRKLGDGGGVREMMSYLMMERLMRKLNRLGGTPLSVFALIPLTLRSKKHSKKTSAVVIQFHVQTIDHCKGHKY